LTAATYTAVANRFRQLWGKEAGWAHSVLFTADLKAFSERVVAKTEVKEEKVTIKQEESDIVEEIKVDRTVKTKKRIKTEEDEPEHEVVQTKRETRARSKRQRPG
jgi:N-glycosylase/DNA lyase